MANRKIDGKKISGCYPFLITFYDLNQRKLGQRTVYARNEDGAVVEAHRLKLPSKWDARGYSIREKITRKRK